MKTSSPNRKAQTSVARIVTVIFLASALFTATLLQGKAIAYFCGYFCVSPNNCIPDWEALPGDCGAVSSSFYSNKPACLSACTY